MPDQDGPKTESGFRGTQVRDDGTGPVLLEHRHRLLVSEGPDRGVEVEIPAKLEDEEAELLYRLAELRGESVAPPSKGVFARLKSAFQ